MRTIRWLLLGGLVGAAVGFAWSYKAASSGTRGEQIALALNRDFSRCVGAIPRAPKPPARVRSVRIAQREAMQLMEAETDCVRRSGVPGLTIFDLDRYTGYPFGNPKVTDIFGV